MTECITNRGKFQTKGEAILILHKNEHRGRRVPSEVFLCDYCGLWHIKEIGTPLIKPNPSARARRRS